jgi:hypothetical protein
MNDPADGPTIVNPPRPRRFFGSNGSSNDHAASLSQNKLPIPPSKVTKNTLES